MLHAERSREGKGRKEKFGVYPNSGSWQKDHLLLSRRTKDKLVAASVWMMLRTVFFWWEAFYGI